VLDRAGITGPDGPSHHGMWDLSILGVVPGIRVAAPRDTARLRELLREAVDIDDGPTVLRYPKAIIDPGGDIDAVACADGIDVLHRSHDRPPDALLVAAGALAGPCLKAARLLEDRGIGVTVVDPRWVIPVNPALVDLAARHDLVVTAEDGCRSGGMGVLVAQACGDAGLRNPIRNLGLPRTFIEHGSRNELLGHAGLSGEEIAWAVLRSRAGIAHVPRRHSEERNRR
jgi:1-deoxy-D-xylulose-5-phosphate synthase